MCRSATVQGSDERWVSFHDCNGLRRRVPRYIYTIGFSPDGRLLARRGGDEVKLWNLLTYEEIATLSAFLAGLRGLAFKPGVEAVQPLAGLPGRSDSLAG